MGSSVGCGGTSWWRVLCFFVTTTTVSCFLTPSSSSSSSVAIRDNGRTVRARSTRPCGLARGNQSNSNSDSDRPLWGVFTGGLIGGSDRDTEQAAKIASRLRTVTQLGWKGPAKRRGNTRPRHRAYGGETELAVQDKANYDPTNPNCVESWLSKEEFENFVQSRGPAADTVFVALAGGAAYAECDRVETLLKEWNSGRTFDRRRFDASVQKGRIELASGWAVFLSLTGFAALGILFPTNPAMKSLEGAIETWQNTYRS